MVSFRIGKVMALNFIPISVSPLKCYVCSGQEECANLDNTKVLECPNTDDGCIWRFEDCMLLTKKVSSRRNCSV